MKKILLLNILLGFNIMVYAATITASGYTYTTDTYSGYDATTNQSTAGYFNIYQSTNTSTTIGRVEHAFSVFSVYTDNIIINGNYAYVIANTGWQNLFEIIDISNKTSPTIVGYAVGRFSGTMHIDGNYVIFSGDRANKQIIDITDKLNPEIVEQTAANSNLPSEYAHYNYSHVSEGKYLTFFMNSDGTRQDYKFGSTIADEWDRMAEADFDGDSILDTLFRSKLSGRYLIFLMNQDGTRKAYKFGTVLPDTYSIIDTNDFNGDGISDILIRRANGQYVIFFIQNGSRSGYKFGTIVPHSYVFQDSADFNNDGIADILWRRTNGQYVIFFMNSDGSRKSVKFGSIVPTDYVFKGVKDLNDDGNADIIWGKPAGWWNEWPN